MGESKPGRVTRNTRIISTPLLTGHYPDRYDRQTMLEIFPESPAREFYL